MILYLGRLLQCSYGILIATSTFVDNAVLLVASYFPPATRATEPPRPPPLRRPPFTSVYGALVYKQELRTIAPYCRSKYLYGATIVANEHDS
jgi:hypothetical protein